jgi:hypothetical protein
MKNFWFYDKHGAPTIRLLENDRLVDHQGRNLGFISENKIFNVHGKHRGWLEHGMIRDLNGLCVAFSRGASDSPRPLLPILQINTLLTRTQPPSPSSGQERPKRKPAKGYNWSALTPKSLFD